MDLNLENRTNLISPSESNSNGNKEVLLQQNQDGVTTKRPPIEITQQKRSSRSPGNKKRSSNSQRNSRKGSSGGPGGLLNKNRRKLVTGDPDKEKRFYSVSILKLTKSFERQFFNLKPVQSNEMNLNGGSNPTSPRSTNDGEELVSSIKQTEAYKKRQIQKKQLEIQLREEHPEYYEKKDVAIKSVRHINKIAYFMLIFGILLLLCEIIAIFTRNRIQGFIVLLAVLTVQHPGNVNTYDYKSDSTTSVVLFTSFTVSLLYLLQACFAFYTFQAKNCECAIILRKETLISLICLCVLEGLSILFGAIYADSLYYVTISEEDCNATVTVGTGNNPTYTCQIGEKVVQWFLVYDLILIMFMLITQLLTLRLASVAQKRFRELHSYLMNYKMSPNSRIFKRHKPQMDAVFEVPSAYERSESLRTGTVQSSGNIAPKLGQTIEDIMEEEFRNMSLSMSQSNVRRTTTALENDDEEFNNSQEQSHNSINDDEERQSQKFN